VLTDARRTCRKFALHQRDFARDCFSFSWHATVPVVFIVCTNSAVHQCCWRFRLQPSFGAQNPIHTPWFGQECPITAKIFRSCRIVAPDLFLLVHRFPFAFRWEGKGCLLWLRTFHQRSVYNGARSIRLHISYQLSAIFCASFRIAYPQISPHESAACSTCSCPK
jgi:hypothetical protein